MIYNVLVVFYNNKYIFDFSDFLLPQTLGATYMIHMTNSLNYCNKRNHCSIEAKYHFQKCH